MCGLHARLRNKCSGLNSDLFRNHIRNNSLCDLCNVVEDACHYYFNGEHILLKDRLSMTQLEVFNHLNINVILYGNGNWNTEANMVLFRDVHRYRHASKRFLNNLL